MENLILNKKQFRMNARDCFLANSRKEYKGNTAKNPGPELPKNPYIVKCGSPLT